MNVNVLTSSAATSSDNHQSIIVIQEAIGESRTLWEHDGQKIYDLMAAAFKSGKKVILSFEGLKNITWSFVTKSVGQLYQWFPEEEIEAKLTFTDIPPDQVEFIEEVVETKKAYLQDPEQFKKPMSDEELERLRQKNPGNPWLEMAGKYKDDPLFDDMLAYIEEYRRELDAELEEYDRQLDAEAEGK